MQGKIQRLPIIIDFMMSSLDWWFKNGTVKRAENVQNKLNRDVVRFTFRELNLFWNK